MTKNNIKDFKILELVKIIKLLKILIDLNTNQKKNDDQNTWSSFFYEVPYEMIIHTPKEVIKQENNSSYNKINKLFSQSPLPFEKDKEKEKTTLNKVSWLEYLIQCGRNWLEYLIKSYRNCLEIWISFCNDYPTLVLLVLGGSWIFFLLSLTKWIKKNTLKTILRRLLKNKSPLWEFLYNYWYDFEDHEYTRMKHIEYDRYKSNDLRLRREQKLIESQYITKERKEGDVPLHIKLARSKAHKLLIKIYEDLVKKNENNRLLFLKNCEDEAAVRNKLYNKVLDMVSLDTESTADTMTLKELFEKHKVEPVTPETQKELITKWEQKRNETIDVHPINPIIIKKGLKTIKHIRKPKPSQKKK
jgi:hypothetical protein